MKIIFGLTFFLCLFMAGSFGAHAASATITATSLGLDQLPFTSPAGPADLVQKIFTWAILLSGTLAVIMIVYGGIRYVILAGNESAQKDAKEIILGSVWGIVLLAGGWLILNTINPQLVNLSNLGLENVMIHGNETTLQAPEGQTQTGAGVGGSSIACRLSNVNTTKLAQDAQNLITALGEARINNETSCTRNFGKTDGALQNLKDVAQGISPIICGASCDDCKRGGLSQDITICPSVIEGLLALNQKVVNNIVPSFKIGYLTGGTHTKTSGHFKGMKVDITPLTHGADYENWQKLYNNFPSVGGAPVCEYYDPERKTTKICSEMFGQGKTGQHLDVSFGGASTPSLTQQQALVAELKNIIVQEYLPLGPDLKGDGSFGILPGRKEFTCPQNSSPYWNIRDISEGKYPSVCNKSFAGVKGYTFTNLFTGAPDTGFIFLSKCECNTGGTSGKQTLNKELLKKLIDLQKAKSPGGALENINFRVVTLMGGINGTVEDPEEYSYGGTAFEIVPIRNGNISSDIEDWRAILTKAKSIVGDPMKAFVTYESIYREPGIFNVPLFDWDFVSNVVQKRIFDLSDGAILDCKKSSFNYSSPSVLYNEGEYNENGVGFKFDTSLSEGCYNPRIRVLYY